MILKPNKMKKLTYLILSVVLFAQGSFGQDTMNFYDIRNFMDAYYDSLIQIRGIDSMEGSGYNPYMRWVRYWEPKLYPSGNFNIAVQKTEDYLTDYYASNSVKIDAPFSLNWEEVGPIDMPESSDPDQSRFSGIGRIHYIEFDQTDASG
jgi:hypothetical protein